MLRSLKRHIKRMLFANASPETLVFLKHLRERGAAKSFPFARTTVVRNDVPVARVLVLSPHPDDEAIGAGGAIGLHRRRGNRVLVAYLTDDTHSPGPSGATAVRAAEAQSVARDFGLEHVFLGGEDGSLAARPEIVERLKAVLDDLRPSEIYLPSCFDAHKDHYAANRILLQALRQAGSCDATVFGYEVWTNLPFPNYVLDLGEIFAKKLEMISMYASQTRTFDFVHFCTARAGMHYTMHVDPLGRGFAEAFLCCPAASYMELIEGLPAEP